MNSSHRTNKSIQKMVTMSILVAVVLIFQYLGGFIHIGPTSITLVLVPIVLGGMLVGPAGGAFLGLVFGFMTLWAGISGTDPFTATLFSNQPIETALLCLGKAVLAGLLSGLVYKAFSGKNRLVASILASMTAPIVNTGIFILGGLFMLNGTLNANFVSGTTLVYFLVIICAGWNFIGEFIVNLIFAPAINTVVNAVEKQRKS